MTVQHEAAGARRGRAAAPPERPTVGLTTQIAALAAVSRRLFRERMKHEQWAVDAGLRPPSYGVLLCVDRLGPVSQKRVADEIGTDPSDLVAVIDILEHAGYVARERDADDRRRYSLTLTSAGREALDRFGAVAAEVHEETLAPLDEADRAVFERLVQRVLEHHVRAARAGEPS